MKRRRMPNLAALALTTALVAAAPSRAATDLQREKIPLLASAEQAFWRGDVDALERMYAQAVASGERSRWNDESAAHSVRGGIVAAFNYNGLDDAYFREVERFTERWAKERPDSVLAQLAYVRTLHARAWHARGGGYWQTVPPSARQEFERLLSKAAAHIADHKAVMMKDTTTHLYLLMVGRSLSWPKVQLQAVLDDGLAKSRTDEHDLYQEMLIALLPKWGGSWDEVAALTAQAGARGGDELYALLWSDAANNIEGNLFAETTASWPRIKAGLERHVARLEANSYYPNRIAYFACLAEDAPAARAALAALGERLDIGIWQAGGTGGQQNYESCLRWLEGQH